MTSWRMLIFNYLRKNRVIIIAIVTIMASHFD